MPDTRLRPPPAATRPNAMVAAASVITEARVPVRRMDSWQEEAWNYYDTVGELRYAVTYVANSLSRCQLMAASPGTPDDPTPIPMDVGPAVDAVARLAGGVVGQTQMLAAFGVTLSVPGIGYLVGEPTDVGETWTVYAPDVIRSQGQKGMATYAIQVGDTEWRELPAEALVVQCWTPNRRKLWEPDSAVRAVLGVLNEIALLDERIHADATSRLAGAGVFVLPTEAEFPKRRPDDPEEDPFTEQLLEAMTVPIKNRESAAAVVPLLVRLPGQYAAAVRHISLATAFDAKILDLRESAIRRLAVGLDLPPEVVLGLADVNHWTAWAVEEGAVKLHVEPKMEVICDALTVGYLRPALAAAGADPDSAVVWYDASDLRVRPDRSQTSLALYDRGELNGDAARRENGFDDGDAPDMEELRTQLVIHTALNAPDQLGTVIPFLDNLVERAQGVVGIQPDPTPPPGGPTGGDGGTAPTNGAPVVTPGGGARGATPVMPRLPAVGPPRGVTGRPPRTKPPRTGAPGAKGAPPRSSGGPPPRAVTGAAERRPRGLPDALLAACDGLVARALEHAGNRLRTKAGIWDGREGCPPPSAHTCVPAGTLDLLGIDACLAGAWDRVPEIADRYDVEVEGLRRSLDGYARSLLASGTPHTYDTLAEAFGYESHLG